MPSQLSKGHTFHDGDTSQSAATLNSIVDNGTILPGAITEQTAAPPVVGDNFLFNKATGGLRKCTLQQILDTVPANSPASTASLRKLGRSANMAAPGNDTRFPAVLRGLRQANGPAVDTAAVSSDLAFTPIDLHTAQVDNHGNNIIDWSASSVFYHDLPANKSYIFSNKTAGQTITIIFHLHGHTATFADSPGLATVGTGTTFWYITLTYAPPIGTVGTGTLI